jgi:hypothetical protein
MMPSQPESRGSLTPEHEPIEYSDTVEEPQEASNSSQTLRPLVSLSPQELTNLGLDPTIAAAASCPSVFATLASTSFSFHQPHPRYPSPDPD